MGLTFGSCVDSRKISGVNMGWSISTWDTKDGTDIAIHIQENQVSKWTVLRVLLDVFMDIWSHHKF